MSTRSLRNMVIALFLVCVVLSAWYFFALTSDKRTKPCRNGTFTDSNIGCTLISEDASLPAVQIFYKITDVVKDQGETFLVTEAPDGTPLRFRLGLMPLSGWALPACKVQNNTFTSGHDCKLVGPNDQIPFGKDDIVLVKVYQAAPPAGVDAYAQKCFSMTKDYFQKMSQRKPFASLSVSTDACSPIAGQVFYP